MYNKEKSFRYNKLYHVPKIGHVCKGSYVLHTSVKRPEKPCKGGEYENEETVFKSLKLINLKCWNCVSNVCIIIRKRT